MNLLILGMLMLKNSTIYEMHKQVEQKFSTISSGSMGSMQTALKKLLQAGLINFEENVENSVNRKVYAITAAGKEHFLENLSQPMAYKEKSMELAKLFFMGMVQSDKRPELLNTYIAELEKELAFLNGVKQTVDAMPAIDEEQLAQMQQQGIAQTFSTRDVRDIVRFQVASLQLAICKITAEIEWFHNFVQQLEGNNNED